VQFVTVVLQESPEVKYPKFDLRRSAMASCTSCYTSETKKDSYDTLRSVLDQSVKDQQLRTIIASILDACGKVAAALNTALVTVEGTSNSFGDVQLTVDIIADKILFDFALANHLVYQAASEEEPELKSMNLDGRFVLCWDPLDGSSIIDNNWSVGTIVGIWDRSTGLLGASGRDQLSSIVVQYGPQCTALVALDDGTYEFTLQADDTWLCSRTKIRIQEDSKIFSPANLRASQDLPGYAQLVASWMEERKTLRYTGGLVPDVYQQFTKRQSFL